MKAQEGEADWPSAEQRRTVRVMAGSGAPRSSIAAYLRINVPRLNALRRHALTVFGENYATPDGTCIRDYVHVTDLAEAHLAALPRLETHGSCRYNVGSGQGASVRQVIDAVARVGGRPVPHIMRPRRAGDPPVLVAALWRPG